MLAVLKVWPLLTSFAVASCVSIHLLSFNLNVLILILFQVISEIISFLCLI